MKREAYYIYARRSSDTEDQQALSIEQQLDALRDLARVRGFDVVEELTESASAKEPGRPVFRELMTRVREGKVHGILVWRLDRLARNMVDGGEVIYYLSNGDLTEIVTPEATYSSTASRGRYIRQETMSERGAGAWAPRAHATSYAPSSTILI